MGDFLMARLIDIGVNLTDTMYRGVYRSKVKHPDDMNDVIQRGRKQGLKYLMCTSGCYSDAIESLQLCEQYEDIVTTVGMHPTRCKNFGSGETVDGKTVRGHELIEKMKELIQAHPKKIVAIGECGLDYDRLHFSSKQAQLKGFKMQLDMASELHLPLFLHSRAAAEDFNPLMQEYRSKIAGGVVHSFTGTVEEMEELLDLGFSIGINGCSMKTVENLAAVKRVPLDRLMLETDGPWCGLRASYAGTKFVKTTFPSKKVDRWEEGHLVKDRNEPCQIIQVAEVVAAVQEVPLDDVIQAAYENTMKMFFPDEPL